MKNVSIRTRLTWAFLLVAVAVMALVMLGFNLAFWSTVQHRMETGRMGGPVMGQGQVQGYGQGRGAGPGGMMGGSTMASPNSPLWETIYEGKDLAFQVSLIAGLIGLGIAAVASYFVAERVSRPLRRLAAEAVTARPGAGTFALYPHDSKEMQELSGALNLMTERIQSEDEVRRNLFADIAHELRHPIALLRGRIEMMQDGVTPVSPEALSALQDEVIRLSRLVADVRELSLAEVGKLSLNLQPVDLAEEIATLRENFEPITVDKAIRLTMEAEPLPVVTADPDRIRQVLANLLSNAVRHTPEGGQITFRAGRRGSQVLISVADTGSGIAPEDLPHIFDRFYRADRSRTRMTGGSGLGLPIARSLARLHGGDLTAANSPEGGAVFTLLLPVTFSPGASS